MTEAVDGDAAVDAKNAPTAAWKTRRRVSHTDHRRPRTWEKQEEHNPRLRAGKESDDTYATYRVAAFQTFLSGRI
jgi:hypothetical protein